MGHGAWGMGEMRQTRQRREMGRWGDEFFASAPLLLEPLLPNH